MQASDQVNKMVQAFMEVTRKEQRLFDKVMLKQKYNIGVQEQSFERFQSPGPVRVKLDPSKEPVGWLLLIMVDLLMIWDMLCRVSIWAQMLLGSLRRPKASRSATRASHEGCALV